MPAGLMSRTGGGLRQLPGRRSRGDRSGCGTPPNPASATTGHAIRSSRGAHPRALRSIPRDLSAAKYGVLLSRSAGPGADPQAVEGLAQAAALAQQGRWTVPVAAAFTIEDAPAAHRLSETGHARGKIVLTL